MFNLLVQISVLKFNQTIGSSVPALFFADPVKIKQLIFSMKDFNTALKIFVYKLQYMYLHYVK